MKIDRLKSVKFEFKKIITSLAKAKSNQKEIL